MSITSDSKLDAGPDKPKQVRWLQTNVRTLIALVVCCAAILWAWRNVAVNWDPVGAETRSIQTQAIGASGPASRPSDWQRSWISNVFALETARSRFLR